jgi:hypothetical protein
MSDQTQESFVNDVEPLSEAAEALLRVEQLPHWLWDPAANTGAIARVLRDAGHAVIASDIADHGFPTHFCGRDFLLEHKVPEGCQAIVTRPPLRRAEEFAAHAIALTPLVALFLPLKFLASECRRAPSESGKLARVHILRRRDEDFAWLIWSRSHSGPIVVHEVSWAQRSVPWPR